MTTRKNMNWTNFFKSISLVLVTSLIAVKVGDLLLPIFINRDQSGAVNSERSINLRELSPNLDIFVEMPDYERPLVQVDEFKKYRLRTNSDGFIIGPKDNTKMEKNNSVDIIFLGGSTTECRYVDEDKRFPYLVGKLLRKKNGQELIVLNGGVSGSHTLHSLISEIGKGLKYHPRYVVLMDAINDLNHLSKTSSYWRGPYDRRIVHESLDKKKQIDNSGYLYITARWAKDLIIPNIWELIKSMNMSEKVIGVDQWAAYRDQNISFNKVKLMLDQDFRASLKSFILMNRAWGIEPILMTQANRIRINDSFARYTYEKNKNSLPWDDFVYLYAYANEIIRQSANEEKVVLIDLEREIPSNSKYIYDAVHMNTNGSSIAAKLISEKIRMQYPNYFIKK